MKEIVITEEDRMSTKELNQEQLEIIKGLAQNLTKVDHPTPILETPADYGMKYEDITFPSMDGVSLAAWYIPANNSDKLIICNHPMTFTRSGFPGHMEPWNAFSDVRVNFHNVYKALHAAGYNVLTYDLRNHGKSDSADNNICGVGLLEYQDVVGA
jgi:pimeloyl-ACP methyl ester carboxylesterase